MRLSSYIYVTYGIAGVIVVAALIAVLALVSKESATIDSVARNHAIYRDLTKVNFLLLKDIPADRLHHVLLSLKDFFLRGGHHR